MTHTRSRIVDCTFDDSLLLIAGTVVAVGSANIDFRTYDAVAHPANRRRLRGMRLVARFATVLTNDLDELIDINRLGNDARRAELRGGTARVRNRREQQDWHIAYTGEVLLNSSKIPAIHYGHHEIQENQTRPNVLQTIEPALAVLRRHDTKSFDRQ
jgi:hypothetical protein